jgi:amino acid permease
MFHKIESERKVFWRAVMTMIMGGIGVGMFGLPYVFSQAGYVVGFAYLIGVALVNTIVLVSFADLLAGTKEHSRLSGVVDRYLGKIAGIIISILTFFAGWGALLAYILVGGEFAYELLHGTFGGGIGVYQVGFFVLGSVLLLGGVGLVGRMESWLSIVLLSMLAVMLIGSAGQVDVQNLMTINESHWFAPFGVVLFALSGLAAIPEMSDILGDYRKDLKKSVITGAIGIVLVYTLFTLIVVGVSGISTSEAAVDGLALTAGRWILWVGGITIFFAAFTSYLFIGGSICELGY